MGQSQPGAFDFDRQTDVSALIIAHDAARNAFRSIRFVHALRSYFVKEAETLSNGFEQRCSNSERPRTSTRFSQKLRYGAFQPELVNSAGNRIPKRFIRQFARKRSRYSSRCPVQLYRICCVQRMKKVFKLPPIPLSRTLVCRSSNRVRLRGLLTYGSPLPPRK